MTGFLYILLALLMLGVLITVHEAGHFLAARLCGIDVVEFAIGMGPKIFSRKGKKGTLFSLRIFPLGGFCAFYGEDEDLGDDPRAFAKQPVWKRFVTTSAGVLMNFVLAFLIIFLFFAIATHTRTLPIIGEISTQTPAQEQGLMVGDRFVEVNGTPVETANDVANQVNEQGSEPTVFLIERDGRQMEITVTPEYNEEEQRNMIGIAFAQETYRLTLWESAVSSVRNNVGAVQELVRLLGNMVFKGEGLDQVTGFVGTIYIIQEQTRQGGFVMFISMMAMISINLGVMNLLPIPGLDGCRLVFLIIEGIRRKPVNPKIEGTVHFIGFVMLIGLMLLVTYQDILRFFRA